jgi:hypothetical protein
MSILNSRTLFLSAGMLFCAAAIAQGAGSVSIDLTGLRISNNLNQSRNSSPQTLTPAFKYSVDFSDDTLVRGNSGLLATLFPNPTPLAQVLETFEPGSSASLNSIVYNSSGAHPFDGEAQTVGGTSSGLTISLQLQARIDASDIASFSITNVVLSPAFVVGSMIFTSGRVTVSGACVGDFNNDGGVDGQDIEAFFIQWSDGFTVADVNADGGVDGQDVEYFFTAWSSGC